MKKIISLFLKFLPRELLQKISLILLPFLSMIYYGKKYKDPISGKTHRKFMPYGRGKHSRDNALSPSSLSLERHRLLWLYLNEKTNIFRDNIKFLNVAPELCFIKKFRNMKNMEYITGDLHSPLADIKFDAHNIPFEDETFDFVMANHLLEHVDDDIKVMSEFFRIMKNGGFGIFQVPFYSDNLQETIEDKSIISPKKREEIYGQSDHVRSYGKDYKKRLESVGFHVEQDKYAYFLDEKIVSYYRLDREIIYLCTKK